MVKSRWRRRSRIPSAWRRRRAPRADVAAILGYNETQSSAVRFIGKLIKDDAIGLLTARRLGNGRGLYG